MDSFDQATLSRLIRRHCRAGAEPIRFQPIPTGKFNTSFFVWADGQELVLRIAPARESVLLFYERNMMRQEPAIHDLLRSRTAVPVPRILAFDDSHEVVDRDFLIMERLPGLPWTECPAAPSAALLREVGEHLAAAHRLTETRYGYLGAHAPMEPQDSWPAAFRVMWGKLLDDVVQVGHYDQRERDALTALLDAHLGLFDRGVAASLLHMDIWHQNILVDDRGCLSGIVDWDRALWGDPEVEFAVLDYCGISEPAFWEGYRGERDLSPAGQTRQVFYYLYELQKYIVIREGRSHDTAGALRYKRHAIDLVRRCFS